MIAKPFNGTSKSQGMLIIRDASYGKRRGIPAVTIHSFNEDNEGRCSLELVGQGRYGRTSYSIDISFDALVEAIEKVMNGARIDISGPAPQPPIKARHISLAPPM